VLSVAETAAVMDPETPPSRLLSCLVSTIVRFSVDFPFANDVFGCCCCFAFAAGRDNESGAAVAVIDGVALIFPISFSLPFPFGTAGLGILRLLACCFRLQR